jgi:hypothetical protein
MRAAEVARSIRECYPPGFSPIVVFGDELGDHREPSFNLVDAAIGESDNCVVMHFTEGERLFVWDPEELSVWSWVSYADRTLVKSPPGVIPYLVVGMQIARASRVRWEWYYEFSEPDTGFRYFNEYSYIDARRPADFATNFRVPGLEHLISVGSTAVQVGYGPDGRWG